MNRTRSNGGFSPCTSLLAGYANSYVLTLNRALMIELKIERFISALQAFCDLAESDNKHLDEFTVLSSLTDLYAAALALPELYEGYEHKDVPSHSWRTVRHRFSVLAVYSYWIVDNPLTENEGEPLCCFLPDDLADLYLDCKMILGIYESGNIKGAVLEARLSRSVWQNVLGMMYALDS